MSELHDWLIAAKPGEQHVYWTGDLAMDRADTHGAEVTPRAVQAQFAGNAAWRLYVDGLILLVQRKIGKQYQYMAIKKEFTKKPYIIEPIDEVDAPGRRQRLRVMSRETYKRFGMKPVEHGPEDW